MMKDFYLYLSCTDSSSLYPNNRGNDFTVSLCRNISLPGVWECGLKEIDFKGKSASRNMLNIVCDSCERSYVNDDYISLLRRIVMPPLNGLYSETFADTYYKRVTEKELSTITISIRGRKGVYKGLDNKSVSCVLHFKPV
jgi:hypothetical protein